MTRRQLALLDKSAWLPETTRHRFALPSLARSVGEDDCHPLADLMETLAVLIETYDRIHYPSSTISGTEVLSDLMQEHDLKPADLRDESGTQDVVRIRSFEWQRLLMYLKFRH